MGFVNARINFGVNGGTLSGTSPVYVSYQGTGTYSTTTGTTSRAIPTATPPTGYTAFEGWYTASSGGNQVVDASGNVQPNVSSWTDSSSRWIRTSTSTSANYLYAHYTPETYSITLARNCPTAPTGSTSTTATYYSTTLAAITVPTCANRINTRTVSGWTIPSDNNAGGAIVNGGTNPGTLNSTSTTTHTFNGWYIGGFC